MRDRHPRTGTGYGATDPARWPATVATTPTIAYGTCTRPVTPLVAQEKPSAIKGCTRRHACCAASLRLRKGVDETFGWMKTVSSVRRTRYRNLARPG